MMATLFCFVPMRSSGVFNNRSYSYIINCKNALTTVIKCTNKRRLRTTVCNLVC